MLAGLVLAPLALALATLAIPSVRFLPWMVPLGGAVHVVLTGVCLSRSLEPAFGGWLVLDPLGKLVLGFLSLYFLLCSLYVPGYLRLAWNPDFPGRVRSNRRNRIFCSALLVFLAMMTLIILSHHLGLMWVAVEAATLIAAPLLYFNRNARSLEATWKYLLIGSVGIALALLGSFFLAYSALHGGLGSSLLFEDLVRDAPRLSRPWLQAAFVLLFVGYGTKMGLAPMHTWKPDAYGEAPGVVGALLAGGLTHCAFLAVLRFWQICTAAGQGAFAREIMLTIGLFSMGVAGVFMARQRDYKRMLAYSSIEHMGILVVGVSLGRPGIFGALLHLLGNGFGKGVLFLSAGNIHQAYGSKITDEVTGVLRRLPASGALFLAGFFAITGSPPFAPFLSEFTILRAAMAAQRPGVAAVFLVMLLVVFLGMGSTVVRMVQGEPTSDRPGGEPRLPAYRDSFLTVAPIVGLLALVLTLGLYLPPPLQGLLEEATAFLEVRP